jgi:magnesium chelatase family protein
LFDRIDLHVDVPAVTAADLSLPPPRESSTEVAARVRAARIRQQARYRGSNPAIACNAELDGQALTEHATPDADGVALLTQAAERLKLSARGYHRVLRVARTLADMDASTNVRRPHVAEALSYRRLAPAR